MLIAALVLSLAGSAIPAGKAELELNAIDRRALIVGLERRVGGKFVLSGVRDAAATCERERACLTADALLAASRVNHDLASANTVGQLLGKTMVAGEAPVALVSVRGARRDGGNIVVRASVYDRNTARWVTRDATIAQTGRATRDFAEPGTRTLLSWLPVTRSSAPLLR